MYSTECKFTEEIRKIIKQITPDKLQKNVSPPVFTRYGSIKENTMKFTLKTRFDPFDVENTISFEKYDGDEISVDHMRNILPKIEKIKWNFPGYGIEIFAAPRRYFIEYGYWCDHFKMISRNLKLHDEMTEKTDKIDNYLLKQNIEQAIWWNDDEESLHKITYLYGSEEKYCYPYKAIELTVNITFPKTSTTSSKDLSEKI